MNAPKIIAATLLTLAGIAHAADAPATAGAAKAAVVAGATAAATASTAAAPVGVSKLNLPALDGSAARSREAVRAEAIEAVKNHKTTLAQQLDLIK